LAAEAGRKRRAEADEALKPLAEKAADARTTFAEFAGEVAAFRAKYSGTRAAVRATELLTRLPSPLDQLDSATIPEDAKAAWKASGFDGRDVVAVLGEHRGRHYGAVGAAAFTPDGGTIISCGSENAIRFWDAATLHERPLSQRLPETHLTRAAWAPDGRLLLTSHDSPNIVRLWDTQRGKLLRDWMLNEPIKALAFTPDNRWAAFGIDDSTVRLVDLESGEERRRFKGESAAAKVAISPDGKYVLSFSVNEAAVRLWNVDQDKPVGAWGVDGSWLTDLTFSIDSRKALAAQGIRVIVWDVDTRQERSRFAATVDQAAAVLFSPDRRFALFGAAGRGILLDLADGSESYRFQGHEQWVRSLGFSPDGKFALTGDERGNVRIWNVATGKQLQQFSTGQLSPYQLAMSPDGKWALTFGDEGTLRLWDVATGKEVQPLGTARNPGNWVFSPDGSRAAFFIGTRLYLWDVAGWREERRMEGHANPISSAAFAPDGKRLLSGDLGGELFLWEVESGQKLSQARARGQVSAMSFAADGGKALLAVGGGVVLWDPESGQTLATFETGTEGFVHTALLSSDGRRAIAATNDAAVHIWDVAGRRKVRRLDKVYWCPALSPDGRLLACRPSPDAPQIQLWNLEKDAPAEPATVGEGEHFRDLAFAPDGKMLAVTYEDGRVRLFDVVTGKKWREWQMPGMTASGYDGRNLSFAPDGRHLAVANANGTVYLLRLDKPPAPKP
jgi:WD40 repeat protein